VLFFSALPSPLAVDTHPAPSAKKSPADSRHCLLQSARQNLAGLLDISGIEAGLQTVGWLQRGINAESAAAAAAKRNVEVTPLSIYAQGNVAPSGLQLGFAAIDAKEIRRGVQDLAIALEQEMKASNRRGKKKSV
jgi:GntR family transcriptional regulator / MocR family aminotransferase